MEKKTSILVVEDDAEMRETLSDILSDKGYKVKTVGTGKEALTLSKEEKFPTCLIDLKLPDITGIEVLKGLKAINPETYIIIITAFASKETAIEALKADAYCYIEKPLDINELLTAIERASEAYLLLGDKKKAEEELRKSEEKYRSLVESTEDSVYLLDRNCRYLFMNEKHLTRLGLSSDQFLGHAYGDFHSAEETKDFNEKVTRVFETGISLQHEYKEKEEKWFLRTLSPVKDPETGMVTAVTVVSKDIIGLKRTEKELTETRDYLDNIIESSADAIVVVDMNGIVRDWNKSAEDIMGYCADEVIGTSNRKFFADPEEADRILEQVRREGEIKNHRAIVLRKDGKPVHISMSAALLKDKNGVPIGTVRVSRDITEQKRTEEEREKLLKELEAKNTEMERFTYVVSHDLRSPLVTIHGFVGILREDLEQNKIEKVENDLKYIETAVTKMDRLLSDTLQLSRIGRVVNPPEDVPFGELVQEARVQTAEQIKSSGVEVSVAEDFPAVHVDHMRIVEVLVNLLENSMNYMGEQPHPKIEVGYRVDGEETVFFVKDNGIGIEPSQHEKVFELFYKLDKNSKGTGAGLAIVKRIIEVHGGRVWIESEKGKGCMVCFTLPVK